MGLGGRPARRSLPVPASPGSCVTMTHHRDVDLDPLAKVVFVRLLCCSQDSRSVESECSLCFQSPLGDLCVPLCLLRHLRKEAQKRQGPLEGGCEDWDLYPGRATPRACACPCPFHLALFLSLGGVPADHGSVSSILTCGFPGRHAAPGGFHGWPLLQTYGPAEQMRNPAGRGQWLRKMGSAGSPAPAPTGAVVPQLGRAGGQASEGPRSASLLRSFSCRHNTLKTPDPTLHLVCKGVKGQGQVK